MLTHGHRTQKRLLISTCIKTRFNELVSTTTYTPLYPTTARRKTISTVEIEEHNFIKKLIWIYFFLLLTEGAFRKWFLPNLSQAFLIIRDPVVLWIYYLTIKSEIFPSQNKYISFLTKITIVACFSSIIINQTHPVILLYGIHTNYLHLPLAFIMGRVLKKLMF